MDVHLERGAEKIAVEIAIVSMPEREISHITHCLSDGYAQVFTLFADEPLLARIAQVLEEAFSTQEQRKVRLLPLSMLSSVG